MQDTHNKRELTTYSQHLVMEVVVRVSSIHTITDERRGCTYGGRMARERMECRSSRRRGGPGSCLPLCTRPLSTHHADTFDEGRV